MTDIQIRLSLYPTIFDSISGISIIFIKPRPAPPSMLSFLSPFTLEVWVYTAFGKKNIISLCI